MSIRTDTRVVFAGILVAVLAFVVFQMLLPYLSALLAAALLAFVLRPLHRRLAPHVGERTSSALLVTLAVALVVVPLTALASILTQEVTRIAADPGRLPDLEPIEAALRRTLGIDVSLRSRIRAAARSVASALQWSNLASAGFHAFLSALLLLFVLYYLLKDGPAFVDWTKRVVPLPDPVQAELYDEADTMTWAVLKGHMAVAVVQGTVSGVGLLLVGVPDATFWTVVMMFLALVPMIGVAPVLGGAAVFLVLRGDVLGAGFIVVYGFTAVAVTDDYLRAYFVDRGSSMHSAVVLLGVFGGVTLLGPIGLFVGPILFGLFKAAVEVVHDYYLG